MARSRWTQPVLVVSATVLAASAAAAGAWRGGQEGAGDLAWAGVVVATVAAVVVVPRRSRVPGASRRLAAVVAAIGLCAALAYGFGSNNGFFAQSGAALPLVTWVAVGAVLAVSPSGPRRPTAVASAMALLLAVGSWTIVDRSTDRPYRQAPLAEAYVAVAIGGDRGTVRLDPDTARAVAALRAAAEGAGWRRGTPMLDFSWYSASTVYLLGADPPPTVLVSVGGFDHVDDLARLTLREAARDGERWHDAWLLTTVGSPSARRAPDPRLVGLVGRRFPQDYRSLGTFALPSGAVELWRPRR